MIVDARTITIANTQVRPLLDAVGIGIELLEVPDTAPDRGPICSSALSQRLAAELQSTPDTIIAVGSGTLTDIAKQISGVLDARVVVVATAASMNGFTSSLAATLDEGVKLTVRAPTPKAAWALPEILRDAPASMSAAGLGDLHSKPVSSADWRLSHLLNDAPWDLPVVELLGTVTALMDGVAQGLHDGDPEAYGQLFAGLCLTGIAMQAASPGSQASGAEHLVSHYLDMIAGSADFAHQSTDHGAQVAVGCMVALAAWEFAQAAFERGDALGPIPAELWDAPARDAHIQAHFRGLAPTIAAMHAKAPQSLATIEARRRVLAESRGAALRDAAQQLPDRAWLEAELALAGCPQRFSSIGVSRALALDTLRYAPWVRARYTILHLIYECGWYEAFIPYALERSFGGA